MPFESVSNSVKVWKCIFREELFVMVCSNIFSLGYFLSFSSHHHIFKSVIPLFMMHVLYNLLSVKMEIAAGQVEWLPLALCLQADLQRRWWILKISFGGCFLHVARCTLTFPQIGCLVRGKASSLKQSQLSWTTAAQSKETSMVHFLSSL